MGVMAEAGEDFAMEVAEAAVHLEVVEKMEEAFAVEMVELVASG